MVLVTSRFEHVEACQRCADTLGAHLQACGLDDAATRVARWRPFPLHELSLGTMTGWSGELAASADGWLVQTSYAPTHSLGDWKLTSVFVSKDGDGEPWGDVRQSGVVDILASRDAFFSIEVRYGARLLLSAGDQRVLSETELQRWGAIPNREGFWFTEFHDGTDEERGFLEFVLLDARGSVLQRARHPCHFETYVKTAERWIGLRQSFEDSTILRAYDVEACLTDGMLEPSVVWETPIEFGRLSQAKVTANEHLVVLLGTRGEFLAVSMKEGRPQWSAPFGDRLRLSDYDVAIDDRGNTYLGYQGLIEGDVPEAQGCSSACTRPVLERYSSKGELDFVYRHPEVSTFLEDLVLAPNPQLLISKGYLDQAEETREFAIVWWD